jgi:hypothetical protein
MKTKAEIEQLASEHILSENGQIGFVLGYTQCKKDMVGKKLDEDDIKEMALDYIINTGGLPKTIEEWQNALWKFYQSLNKHEI